MNHKLFGIILFGLLAFTACGRNEPGKTADGKTSLLIWQTYNDEEQAIFNELTLAYEALNPQVKITSQRMPHAGIEAKTLTALATRTTPDIARLDGSFVAKLGLHNALVQLDTLGMTEIKDQYLPAAIGSCLINGKLYAVPEQVNGVCLFYDKTRYAEVGLDPNQPPRTWEEFIAFGQKLTDPATNRWGFGMRNSLWWSFPFFNTFGATFLSPDTKTCLLNSEQGIQSFQFQVDLYQKHKVEGGAWRSGGIRDDMGFATVYAMTFNGPWAIKGLHERNIDFGVGLIPAGPNGTSTNVGGQDMVIFRTCKNPKAAFAFLKWISSAEIQAKWCNALGQIPVNALAFPLIDTQKYPEIAIFMEQMKTAVPRPQIMNYGDIENLFAKEMEAALSGSKTVREALDDGCRRANEFLKAED